MPPRGPPPTIVPPRCWRRAPRPVERVAYAPERDSHRVPLSSSPLGLGRDSTYAGFGIRRDDLGRRSATGVRCRVARLRPHAPRTTPLSVVSLRLVDGFRSRGQERSPERDREGGPASATYGSNAISRARLMATATCR